jgi:hypothetical protein
MGEVARRSTVFDKARGGCGAVNDSSERSFAGHGVISDASRYFEEFTATLSLTARAARLLDRRRMSVVESDNLPAEHFLQFDNSAE